MFLNNQIIPSISIADKPTHCCVTNSDKWGYGVFSWHRNEKDAKHNADITEGTVLPVDYVGEELVTPPLVKKVLGI